jgi:hypothetical protein
MANQAAFSAGWASGERLADERRARKWQLADEERQFTVSNLYNKGQALAKAIPSLSGDQRTTAMGDLSDIEADLAKIYHPDHNPGALQKDWQWLQGLIRKPKPAPAVLQKTTEPGTPEETMSMGGEQIKLPATPPYQFVQPITSAMTSRQRQGMAEREKARAAAEIDVEAAGLNPEQVAQAERQTEEATRDWQLEWAKRHGVSDEAITELTEHLAGVPTVRLQMKPLAGTKPYKGSDGRFYQSVQDQRTGEITAMPMPEGYVPPPPASGPIRAWKRAANGKVVSLLIDRQTNKPIPGTENADILPPPYLTQRISQGFFYYVDEDNQVHEIPETRSSGPVLGSGGKAPSGAQGIPGTEINSHTGGDRVIGVKGSAALNKARSNYADAVKIADLADGLVEDHNSEKDALFVLSLIRSEAGRVNQKEIDLLFSAGGIGEGPERWAAKLGHGELPQDLRLQLQNFTNAQVGAAKAAVDALRTTPSDLKKKAKANVDAGISDDEFLQKVR